MWFDPGFRPSRTGPENRTRLHRNEALTSVNTHEEDLGFTQYLYRLSIFASKITVEIGVPSGL